MKMFENQTESSILHCEINESDDTRPLKLRKRKSAQLTQNRRRKSVLLDGKTATYAFFVTEGIPVAIQNQVTRARNYLEHVVGGPLPISTSAKGDNSTSSRGKSSIR